VGLIGGFDWWVSELSFDLYSNFIRSYYFVFFLVSGFSTVKTTDLWLLTKVCF